MNIVLSSAYACTVSAGKRYFSAFARVVDEPVLGRIGIEYKTGVFFGVDIGIAVFINSQRIISDKSEIVRAGCQILQRAVRRKVLYLHKLTTVCKRVVLYVIHVSAYRKSAERTAI